MFLQNKKLLKQTFNIDFIWLNNYKKLIESQNAEVIHKWNEANTSSQIPHVIIQFLKIEIKT